MRRRLAPFVSLLATVALACARRPPAVWVEPVTGMELVLVPAGELIMGSPEGEAMREPGETPHRVRLTRPHYLGRTEVTQAQWRRVMGTSPSAFAGCDDCPVERVNAHDVQRFLAQLRGPDGQALRLPTEAEWEHACRAGTTTPFATGPAIRDTQANFDARDPYPGSPAGGFRGKTVPVTSFPPNAWGLHDLHGNVWEWCADEVCPYPTGEVRDPVGRCGSGLRAIRGGSWTFGGDSMRCALRYTHRPRDSGFSLGFRVAADAP